MSTLKPASPKLQVRSDEPHLRPLRKQALGLQIAQGRSYVYIYVYIYMYVCVNIYIYIYVYTVYMYMS